MSFLDRLERVFFWLSGASTDALESCPAWERRKYVAFGATVLVPSAFALIASAYAISTLTDKWEFIIPIALVWSFIILTVDRALLATYRLSEPLPQAGAVRPSPRGRCLDGHDHQPSDDTPALPRHHSVRD